MRYRDIAKLIPANYRKEILQTNIITHAQSVQSDSGMYYLFTIWKNYIEPNGDLRIECGFCLERILKAFRELEATLVELERENNLLDGV